MGQREGGGGKELGKGEGENLGRRKGGEWYGY